ncbi:MAG: RNA polymerase sigma factor, partial [Acidimicrobiia bacterium]
EETIRVEGGQVLATLIRLTRDVDLAEDALQEAAVVALDKWTADGFPDSPAAWLTTVARRKALDLIRRETRRRGKESEAQINMLAGAEANSESDDRLRLMFTCCHPSLSPETRVILTLRTIGGLTTSEIAHAFLMPEATVGQRISRAKKKISIAGIPYRVPEDHELPDRLPAVLAAVYVVFTAGHHSSTGRLDTRVDLADEAVRLGRMLAMLMPDEPEVHGLLALMLATHARGRARVDRQGDLVLLPDQDRSLWDTAAIAEAAGIIERTLRLRRGGPYQIEAAIACLHGQAASDAETDWKQIVDLYRMLERIDPGPVVRVNRAVAESKVFGPAAGLSLLDSVRGVDTWHLYWSTWAELARQVGRKDEAADAYTRALSCEMNDSDRTYLETRLNTLVGTGIGTTT